MVGNCLCAHVAVCFIRYVLLSNETRILFSIQIGSIAPRACFGCVGITYIMCACVRACVRACVLGGIYNFALMPEATEQQRETARDSARQPRLL